MIVEVEGFICLKFKHFNTPFHISDTVHPTSVQVHFFVFIMGFLKDLLKPTISTAFSGLAVALQTCTGLVIWYLGLNNADCYCWV